jgi:hypothetical protein
MSSNRKPTKKYRPRSVHTNAVHIAINGACRLSKVDVEALCNEQRTALLQFSAGERCADNWRRLADAANISETMAAMGLGSGPQADAAIADAQQALAAVAQRQKQRGTWTLYPAELDALHWLLRLHTVQLEVCSYSEFCAALESTQRRIRQARQGNAPAGAVLVVVPNEHHKASPAGVHL